MNKNIHTLFISSMVLITLLSLIYLSLEGYNYYLTPFEDRFYHPDHEHFKSSGLLGHGIGIIGSFLILFGVFSYMARKRYRFLAKFGLLKHWLEFHIFLCTEGAILILFHTSFKFGGIVSISFWSMVAVVISGIIGRFIYIQIPRTIEGRALNLQEVKNLKIDFADLGEDNFKLSKENSSKLKNYLQGDQEKEYQSGFISYFKNYYKNYRKQKNIQAFLKKVNINKEQRKGLSKMIRKEISLNRKIQWLDSMQKLFKYWHVAHLPFALVMLVIMIIHVIVVLLFGYKWIF